MAVGVAEARTCWLLAAGLLAFVVEVAAAENVAKARYARRRSAYREKVRQQKPQLLFALCSSTRQHSRAPGAATATHSSHG